MVSRDFSLDHLSHGLIDGQQIGARVNVNLAQHVGGGFGHQTLFGRLCRGRDTLIDEQNVKIPVAHHAINPVDELGVVSYVERFADHIGAVQTGRTSIGFKVVSIARAGIDAGSWSCIGL